MTKDQILDLLSRTDQQAMHGEGIDVTKADVVRLLEERKRLLETSKVVAELLGPANMDCDDRCVPLAKAIAFAEKAAP